MRALGFVCLCVFLACCARTDPYLIAPRPDRPAYGAALPAGSTAWSNESLAQVFTRLMHHHEWGASQPFLLRFEKPVRVFLTGPGSDQYLGFLDGYLAELRQRSGIDIRRGTTDGNIIVRFVPEASFKKRTSTQCFVAPGRPDWEAITKTRQRYNWSRPEWQRELRDRTVFLPQTLHPFDVRGCLLEEIAQALGPGNDLYGLADTIFNDDSGHVWPTRIDYMMLRVLYRPEMETGLRRAQTLARARRILDEINPEGRSAPDLPRIRQAEFQPWRNKLHGVGGERKPATVADLLRSGVVEEAERRAPGSNYHCFALFRLANAAVREEAGDVLTRIEDARRVCTEAHGPDDVRLARIRLMLTLAMSDRKNWTRVLELGEGLAERLLAFGREAEAFTAYRLRYMAYSRLEQDDERDQSLAKLVAWGAYAYGDDDELIEEWRLQ